MQPEKEDRRRGRSRLWETATAEVAPHPIEPGAIGEYAMLLRRSGTEVAARTFPAVAAHLRAGCPQCRADLLDLEEFVEEFINENDAPAENWLVSRRLAGFGRAWRPLALGAVGSLALGLAIAVVAFLIIPRQLRTIELAALTPGTHPTIGILSPLESGPNPAEETLRSALAGVGYEDGITARFAWRYWGREPERLAALATELVAMKVDVIVVLGPGDEAVRNATTTIPIVVVNTGVPVEPGLVASLPRPGGNVTGVSALPRDLNQRRLALLRALAPGITRVAVLGPDPRIDTLPPDLELTLTLEPTPPANLEARFRMANERGGEGFLVLSDTFTLSQAKQITELAAQHEIPVMYDRRSFVELGGLAAYGPDPRESLQRAAVFVDKILHGTQPQDLPTEPPTQVDFIVNEPVARALGLNLSERVTRQITELVR
jgi:putative tryptophan/tyrosine transport system substrate-binding protein